MVIFSGEQNFCIHNKTKFELKQILVWLTGFDNFGPRLYMISFQSVTEAESFANAIADVIPALG